MCNLGSAPRLSGSTWGVVIYGALNRVLSNLVVFLFPTCTLLGVWEYILDGLSHVTQLGQRLYQEKRENGINSNQKSWLIAKRRFPWGGDGNKIKIWESG